MVGVVKGVYNIVTGEFSENAVTSIVSKIILIN
jgi:hypothetical protein